MKHKRIDEELKKGGLRVYLRLLKYLRPNLPLFGLSIVGFWLFAFTDVLIVQLTGFLLNALENTGEHPDVLPTDINSSGSSSPDFFSYAIDRFNINLDWVPSFSEIDWFAGVSSELQLIPFIVIFIYFFRGVGLFVGNYSLVIVAQNIVHKLRTELFNKLTILPSIYFDRYDSGQLISKITFNVTQVNTAVTDAVKIIIREGSVVVFILALLIFLNAQLTLIFLAVSPFIALIVTVAGKHLRRYSNKVQISMGAITSICSEMINGYRIMRTYGGENYEKSRFEQASNTTRKQNNKIAFASSLATAINQFFVAIALVVLMSIAIVIIDPEGAAEIVMYMMAVGLLPKSMKQLSDVYNKIQRGLAAAHSIFLQLDESAEKDNGSLEVQRVAGRLELRDLSFAYPDTDQYVLQNINLLVEPGEVVAFVGASGSGKSTLVSLIPRYYDHENGQILLDGREINEYTLKNLRRQIALVSQDVVLFNDTVWRNIAYGDLADASEHAIIAAAENANATEFIEQLPEQFDTVIGEDGSKLSGGQRQRLSIARAFLKDAPVLIFDEATSALDNESEQMIQAAMEKICEGRTTLIIAHRLSTIEKADKIVVLKDGKIVEVGRHQELLTHNGEYAKLYAIQFSQDNPSSESGTTAIANS